MLKQVTNISEVGNYPDGFPQAAALVTADPGFPVYRLFRRGRARVILQYQAELMKLEKKLDELDMKIANDSDTDWTLHESGFHHDENWRPESITLRKNHHTCFINFKDKLKEYDEALIRDYTLRKLPSPSVHARKNVARYFYQTAALVKGENDHMAYIEDLVTVGKGEKDSWMEGSISNALEWKPFRIFKVRGQVNVVFAHV